MSAAHTAARLRRDLAWSGSAAPGAGPALVLLCGLPGTGKSYLAQAIAARHPVAVVRTDEVRKRLIAKPQYTTAENAFIYLSCYALIEQLLRDGYAVVFDATNLLKAGRRRARKIAEAVGAPVLTLLTIAPPDLVAQRLARRSAGELEAFSSDADLTVYDKLAATVEQLGQESEPYLAVDTSSISDMQRALSAVAVLLSRAGERHEAADAESAGPPVYSSSAPRSVITGDKDWEPGPKHQHLKGAADA